jgi:hypothetical protein
MPLDIGVGILLAIGMHEWFSMPLTPLLVAFGIGAALLPDIDVITMLYGPWKHRGLTHYPLLYVPVCFIVFLIAPLPYALLLTLGVYAHFVHDTFGIGWGIAWLQPFSGRKFLLFPSGGRTRALGTFATWLPEQEVALRLQAYEKSKLPWVTRYYFRPNLLAYIEYGVLSIALVTLGTYIW